MTCQEWLNVLAILESIDEVPGLAGANDEARGRAGWITRTQAFRSNPVSFLRYTDDATRAAIWAEVERRMRGGA